MLTVYMKNTRPLISIVIPAYNEQNHIASCLEAIASQTIKPFEVIVVDNCSTDNTREIVEEFPFVTLISETKQGVVYARDRGFDQAKGDIIGRIDSDTMLPETWVANVVNIFNDQTVEAVSGSFHFYDIGISRALDGVEGYLRAWMSRRMAGSGRIFLNGSNMAVRRSAWLKVRSHACRHSGIHEDLDLAVHLWDANLRVIYEASLKANVSARRIDSSFISLFKYGMISPKTYRHHKAIEHIYMYPEIAIALFFYPLLKTMFRAYDVNDKKLKLKNVFGPGIVRVDPALFID